MTATTHTQTHLRAAEAELKIADEAVRQVECEIAPTMEKFSQAHLSLDDLSQIHPNGPEAKKARTIIAALAPQVNAARRRLGIAERRRDAAASRLDSERAAITLGRQAVIDQERRVARQAEALAIVQRQVSEKRVALDGEERRLLDLRRDLAVLIGEDL